jgi:hypothetical protein
LKKNEPNWTSVSEKLKKEITSSHEIIEALLDEEDHDAHSNIEKSHWWNFLSRKRSEIDVRKLKQKTKRIRQEVKDPYQREVEYCKLLGIDPHPVYTHASPQAITKRHLEGDVAWEFRWRYAFVDDKGDIQKKDQGLTWKTLNDYMNQGKIKAKNVLKCASFTRKVKEGTPDELANDDWIV